MNKHLGLYLVKNGQICTAIPWRACHKWAQPEDLALPPVAQNDLQKQNNKFWIKKQIERDIDDDGKTREKAVTMKAREAEGI